MFRDDYTYLVSMWKLRYEDKKVVTLIGRSPHNVMTCINTNTGSFELAEQNSCVIRNLAVSLRGIIGIRTRLSSLPTQLVLFELLH